MGYKNFDLAVYCTVYELSAPNAVSTLETGLEFMLKHLKINKVYLETFRTDITLDKEKMQFYKDFFHKKGIKTSGGITTTVAGNDTGFVSFCYTNQAHLDKLVSIIQYTAQFFDEFILDDFYFTNCKCDSCIKAKGDRSWAEFRTELMKMVSEEYVMKPAKEVNPNVNVIIKYPNWYDHYQGTGYNLEEQPSQFDMIYTGTETRDPQYTQQNLQRYLSYFLMRYMENVKPGKNGGGWFDAFDCMYNMGSYAEQAYLTLFSKAREITLFCMGLLLSRDPIFIPMAGYVFDNTDRILDKLGNPVGVTCYKPYHSMGEDYLHNYIGMLGIPLEPKPDFSKDSDTIFLTASAATDSSIVSKIKHHLCEGRNVIITSGLLQALQGKGLEDITLVQCTDKKVLVNKFGHKMLDCSFQNYYNSQKDILIPQVEYNTNDCWPIIVGFNENNSFPLLIESKYSKGYLYVLTIPDNYGDLYHLPKEVLTVIRETMTRDLFVSIDGTSNIGLFVYDNDTLIVESFLPHYANFNVVVNKAGVKLVELSSSSVADVHAAAPKEVTGYVVNGKTVFNMNIMPATYKVFRCEPV